MVGISQRVDDNSELGSDHGRKYPQGAYAKLDCRLCGADVEVKLTLKPTPIANALESLAGFPKTYPLELAQCTDCGHVQLGHVIPDDIIFPEGAYPYRTPEANRGYLSDFVANLAQAYPQDSKVVEIGSNNGLLTDMLADRFASTIGVDPCGTHWACWEMPFNLQCAEMILQRMGQADIIVANNVFAHINDLDAVFEAINLILAPKGALFIEVQYFPDMVKDGHFDMIYHEHRDYHTLTPLYRFAVKHGLKVIDYERLPQQGGSVRVKIDRRGDACYPIDEPIDWDGFKAKIDTTCAKEIPQGTILFGAPAKAVTLLYNMECVDKIAYCVDDTPEKQGLYLPGTDIKIYSSERLKNHTGPVLLACWNYYDVISKKFPNLTLISP